jgi:two-component system cell cycle sensor histidine kinase/response regulator CckA
VVIQKKTFPGRENNLRRQAEEITPRKATLSSGNRETLSLEETFRLLQNLRVQQVELKMQNEELRRVQSELEASRKRYFDLYDLAPVGYVTLGEKGLILEANLTAADMLGIARSAFVNKPLTGFIVHDPEDQDIYYLHCKMLFETGMPQVCEIRMRKHNAPPFWARVESTISHEADNSPVCREVITNINERKLAELALRESEEKYRMLFEGSAHGILAVDITERKQFEDALRESEKKYRLLADNANDVIFVFDMNLNYTYVSPSAKFLRGYEPEEVMKQKPLESLTPSSLDLALKTLAEVMEIENSEHREIRLSRILQLEMTRKDGTTVWTEVMFSFIRDENLRPVNILGVARDITAHKKAEEAVRESEQRMRLALEGTDHALWAIDLTHQSITYTDNWPGILGYGPDENRFDYEWWTSQVHPESLPVFESALIDYFSGHKPYLDWEYRIRNKAGEWQWVHALGTFTDKDKAGFPTRMIGTHRNITARKKAESESRESELRYHDILENINEMYFEINLKGNITFFNHNTCLLSGYSPGEAMGMNFRQYTSPETAKHLKVFFGSIYMTGEKSSIQGFEMIRKDKSTRFMELSVNLIRSSAGETVGFRCIARDTTERKQADDEKRTLEERLQRSEKMEALGTLAGGVAHDLNNVLGVVIGYAELLLMTADESSPNRPRLMTIMRGGEKAAAIVQDLLTLARRGVAGRQVLNLNAIIAGFRQSPEFEKLRSYHSAIKINTDLHPDLLNISGSSVHIDKTLFNLIANACEAMPDGGVLTIKTFNQYLDKPIQGYDEVRAGEYAVLSLSDTGEGIPAAQLKRIFEPFYTRKAMGRSGTGLGLAVVWGTVKDHDGYINVQSEEGKGSIFTLYFPITREETASEAAAVSISEYMGSGETVLVVDDVKEQRNLAAEMLRKLQYDVTTAASGEEAVAYLGGHEVDLMLLDMIMDPGMDGLDTYKSVLEIHPKQKAIVISGFSESDRAQAVLALGAGSYVGKPYVMEKLGMAVRNELDRK